MLSLTEFHKMVYKTATLALSFSLFASDGESIPRGENQSIEKITALIRATVEKKYATSGHAKRDAHHKAHGCVRAEFSVIPDLPENISVGLFSKSRTYSAWIRFSNGSGSSQDDHDGDGRGMAIKILGVDGAKLSEEELYTQDFLMINHPVFFVRNAADYVIFSQSTMNGNPLRFFLHPKRIFHEFSIANAIRKKKLKNPLSARYWSMTPSKLGQQQMKFSAIPCAGQAFYQNDNSENFLGNNMKNHLATKEACFDFAIQVRTNPNTMPIEDATIEWNENIAPFQKVARIIIPNQIPDQSEFCETLSYNPWHSLIEHRPLGGISRVRKRVYQEISTTRLNLNRQRRNEPRN